MRRQDDRGTEERKLIESTNHRVTADGGRRFGNPLGDEPSNAKRTSANQQTTKEQKRVCNYPMLII